MNNIPKISIIMSVYNTPKEYLHSAVKSILSQTIADFEFIIYNDGSNEKTRMDLLEIVNIDARIVFIDCDENHGLAFALNQCLKVSRGNYIARMDSDDISAIDRLEKEMEYLEQFDLDVVGSDMFLFENNKVWGKRTYKSVISNKDFLSGSPLAHPTVFGKKEAFLSVQGYSEEKCCLRVEDYDLWLRMQI